MDYKSAYEGLRDAVVETHREQSGLLKARKAKLEEMQATHHLPNEDPDVQFTLGAIKSGADTLRAFQGTLMTETAKQGEPLDPSQFFPLDGIDEA